MNCPKCQSEMILRDGKYGKFWGCGKYPKCKTIVPYNQNQPTEKKTLKKITSPSHYQKDIFEWVLNGEGNAVVSAAAGSGKTTTIEHGIGLILENNPGKEVIYAVFNTHVKNSAVEKGLPAFTTHQMGLYAITSYLGKRPEIKDDKVEIILEGFNLPDDDKWMIAPVSQVVSKVKATVCPLDDNTLDRICDRFGIEINGSGDKIFNLVRQVMEINNKQVNVVDFSDMIFLPVKLNMPIKKYDWVVADESQDMARCQIELLIRSLKPGGRFIGVGDKFQSIYSWRGADIEAMERIQKAFDAKEMPLSITYRCPKSHVEFINKLFPEYPFEVWENAKQGEILEMSYDKFIGKVESGALVMSRTNAPLVKPCFELIRVGVKAVIKGRDIGKGLVSLIERFKSPNVDQMLYKLYQYRDKEIAKLILKEKLNQAQALDDKVETIIAISEGCDKTWEVIQKINEVFSDKNEGVVFSTVHRAKGDEAENTYILYPQNMPSKWAKKDYEITQERNVMIVAFSRSKSKMVFVGGPAPTSFESTEMWAEKEVEEQIINTLPGRNEVYHSVEIKPENEVKVIPVCPF